MVPLLAVGGVVGLGLGAWLWCHFRRMARRRALLAQSLTDHQETLLREGLPPYAHLTGDERQRLHGAINVFLDEKRFEGCGGLVVTEVMRLSVAGQACLLLLNRPIEIYPRLHTILLYPSTYTAPGQGGENDSVRLGESWRSGLIVLAWDSVAHGVRNFKDGHNVTVHEFAHQLDQIDGDADGAPLLGEQSAYRSWAKVLSREFASLQRAASKGRRSVMDACGATHPAEFFAVATEAFFEKPIQMNQKHPELYAELKSYFKTDPLAWKK